MEKKEKGGNVYYLQLPVCVCVCMSFKLDLNPAMHHLSHPGHHRCNFFFVASWEGSASTSPSTLSAPAVTSRHVLSPPLPLMPAFKSRSVCGRGGCGLLFASTLLALVPPSCSETKSIVDGTTKGATLPWCLGPPFFLTLCGLWCVLIFTIQHTLHRQKSLLACGLFR